MKSTRFTPQRYTLNKVAVEVVKSRHPWIFRSHVTDTDGPIRKGQWLQLQDQDKTTLGYGIYGEEGIHGIRIFKRDQAPPTLDWIKDQITKALKKRENLKNFSNAYRALHGENDNFPAITFDVYDTTGVLQTYSPSIDTFGRYIAQLLKHRLDLKHVLWKYPAPRKEDTLTNRTLFGHPPRTINFTEGPLEMKVNIHEGQKTGTFLDLRGLRKWLRLQNWKGTKVLNLFSYTGSLGLAAKAGNAGEITNVDIAKPALKFGEKHHPQKGAKWIKADVFEWLKQHPKRKQYGLIIIDPPQLASTMRQVGNALDANKRLYQLTTPLLKNGGILIACCCTARITRPQFKKETGKIIGRDFKLIKDIDPEDDHPVGFSEGDYLKISIYQGR